MGCDEARAFEIEDGTKYRPRMDALSPLKKGKKPGVRTSAGAESRASTGDGAQEYLELLDDLKALVAEGRDPKEIAVELNLPADDMPAIIQFLTSRGTDGLL